MPLLRELQYIGRLWHAALGEANLAVFAYQVDGALHNQTIGVVELGDALSVVDKQRIWQVMLLTKLTVALGRPGIYAVHDGVMLGNDPPIVADVASLLRSTRCVVGGIKHKHDVLFSAMRAQAN